MGFLDPFSRKSKPSKQEAGPSASKPRSPNEDFGLSIVVAVDNAQVDIVFVHGLTGHREGTWTATGQDEPWFKSLLPKDLPTARIITFGYDANVANFIGVAGQNTVREHARNLINELAAHRRNDVGRPIIFVAHSLGGLVCQDALLICINPNEEAQSDILSSTCGIAFLGTPHAGSDLKKFAAALVNIVSLSLKKPNKKILNVLGRESEILANIKNDFMTMVHRHLENAQGTLKPIRLHAFIEELPVDYLGCRVVEPDSAKIPGYNSETIHANHMEMTKFNSKDDSAYVKVLDRLKVWTGDDDSSISLKYVDKLRLMLESLWPGVDLAKSEPPASASQLCESSSIEPSLKWFTESSEYTGWINAHPSKLWLHGEDGDGKTVIMSYILRSLSCDTLLGKSDIVSIFCSCNDSEEGLVASIALQLLQNKSQAKVEQTMFSISKFSRGNQRLYINYLWGLLVELVRVDPIISFIIDGIDKLNFSVRSSLLYRLRKIEDIAETMSMRVLMSSSNNEDMKGALRDYTSIYRERERREFLKTLKFQEWNAREAGVQDVKGAGKRFFCQPEYRSWADPDGPSVLWLEGKPGSGKSTLTKFMVDELEKNSYIGQQSQSNHSHDSPRRSEENWVFNNSTDKSSVIARFYYSFRGGNTQTSHELMLRSIVYQIWRENSKLFPLIRNRYRQRTDSVDVGGEQKPLWSYDFLKLTLESLRDVNFKLSVFIIVDGMDESNNDKRVDVLNFLINLARPNPTGNCIVKVFVASRPETNINSRLRLVHCHIKLQEVNQEDIRMVVEGWIKQMVSEAECEEATVLEVKDYIMKYSDGVFMWVTLVLRDLQRYISNGGYTKLTLDARLRSLPKELGGKDGFYRAMVDSLVENFKEDEEQQERGRRILLWVTFAKRPISVTELRDALATPTVSYNTGLSAYVIKDNRPRQLEKAILSTCGGLAEIRNSGSGKIVQLIHQTAREFLLDKSNLAEPYHLEEVQGDIEIAMACCRYLSIVFYPDFPPGEASAEIQNVETVAEHLSDKSLLVYTLANFRSHLDHLGGNDEKVRDEFMTFVKLLIKRSNSSASLLLGPWIEALKLPTKLKVDKISASLCIRNLLSYAAETRKKEVATILLSLRSDLLHIEAGKGHPITMEQQLQDEPSVIHQRIGELSPFAATNYHRGGINLLVRMGVDVDLKDNASRTALSYAAENGHVGSIGRLLEEGADVNSKDAVSRTPLVYAVENGQEGSLKLLLKHGARDYIEGTAGRTQLSCAAANGHMGIVMLLLKDGADASSKDMAGRTPLSYAAENGHMGSLRLLLNYRADVNSKDAVGRTPLSYAAQNGHTGSVKLLLHNRFLDVNSKDTAGRTPLSYAIENRRIAMVDLLQLYTTT